MTALDIVLEIALLVVGVLLVAAVLLQKSKSQGLSGTIAGGAETFYGKGMGAKKDKILSIATIVLGIVFVILALLVYLKQAVYTQSSEYGSAWENLVDIVGKVDQQ